MPFQLSGHTDPETGEAVSYFVISKIIVNPLDNVIGVDVNGYVDQVAFASNLQPVLVQGFTIQTATYTAFLSATTIADIPIGTPQSSLLQELIGALQTNMLTLPFFSGAIIVS